METDTRTRNKKLDAVKVVVNEMTESMKRYNDYTQVVINYGSQCDVIAHDNECSTQANNLLEAAGLWRRLG